VVVVVGKIRVVGEGEGEEERWGKEQAEEGTFPDVPL
jgi:hypothetical protein